MWVKSQKLRSGEKRKMREFYELISGLKIGICLEKDWVGSLGGRRKDDVGGEICDIK